MSAVSLFWYYRLGIIQTYAVPKLEKIVGFPINAEITNLSLRGGFTLQKVSLGPKDKPIIRAQEVQIDISIGKYLFDLVKTQDASEIIFSEIKVNQAILSARQLENGDLQFFPEVSKPSSGSRQTDEVGKEFKWLISNLKIVDSAIEFELRSQKKQVSINKINLDIENIGNGATSDLRGDLQFFVRDFGIDTFDPNRPYENAINATLIADSSALSFSDTSRFVKAELKFELVNISAYINGVAVPKTDVNVVSRLDNSEGFVLEYLQILDANKNFNVDLQVQDDSKYKFNSTIKNVDVAAIAMFFEEMKDREIRGLVKELKIHGTFKGTKDVNEVIFSDIEVTEATIATRLLENGNLQFSPEGLKTIGSKPNRSKIAQKLKWLITKLKMVDSTFELEIRSQKKQLSLNKINFDVRNLGSSSKSSFDGVMQIFVRDFGIDKFDPQQTYENAINGKLEANKCTLYFDENNRFVKSELSLDLLEFDAFINGVGIPRTNVEIETIIDNSEDFTFQNLKLNDKNKNFNLNLQLNDSSQYQFVLGINRIDVGAIALFFDQMKGKDIRGNITELQMQGQFLKSSLFDVKDSLNSVLDFKIDNIYLPRQLIEVPPFNIVFLPFTVISSSFSLIPDSVLPNELINLGNFVSETLKDSQTFRLKNGDFHIAVKDRLINLSEVKIGTDLTGDIYFGGTVDYDHNIEINSGVQLLGVRIPLPITGTLESPYPDPLVFISSIFTEFGLSIMRLPITVVEEIGSWFSASKKESQEIVKQADRPSSP